MRMRASGNSGHERRFIASRLGTFLEYSMALTPYQQGQGLGHMARSAGRDLLGKASIMKAFDRVLSQDEVNSRLICTHLHL